MVIIAIFENLYFAR